MPKPRAKKKAHAKTVRESLKHHFIPHEGNNYHPHIFHSKRTIFYSFFFIAIKVFVIGYAALLPIQAYMAPDVLTAQANKILALTNDVRAKDGLHALDRAALLDRSAEARASDMAENGYFSHTGPNGHTLGYFMKLTDHRYVNTGENLALGFLTAEEVVDAWVKSPSHYANLVDADFKEFGIGIGEGMYEGGATIFIAEHFGDPISLETQARAAPETDTKETPRVALSQQQAQKTVYTPTPTTSVEGSLTDSNIPPSAPAVVEIAQVATATGIVAGASNSESSSADEWTNAGSTMSSPLEKYVHAKSWFAGFFTVFSVSRWVYMAFLTFFAAALMLSLAIEFRKHHPHAVMKAVGLIGLLVVLWRF